MASNQYFITDSPWGVELHQDDVCVIYSVIKVVLGQHQCGFRRRLPIWLSHLFNTLHNGCKKLIKLAMPVLHLFSKMMLRLDEPLLPFSVRSPS